MPGELFMRSVNIFLMSICCVFCKVRRIQKQPSDARSLRPGLTHPVCSFSRQVGFSSEYSICKFSRASGGRGDCNLL